MIYAYICKDVDRLTAEEVKRLEAMLPQQERERLAGISNSRVRKESTAAWALLAHALREVYGWEEMPEPQRQQKGKPWFPLRPDVHFNLSHCRRAVAVAVGDTPVGIDVETTDRYSPALACKVLNESELQRLKPGMEEEMLTLWWTTKEAYAKYTGDGLRGDLRNMLLSVGDDVEFSSVTAPDSAYTTTYCYPTGAPFERRYLSIADLLGKNPETTR